MTIFLPNDGKTAINSPFQYRDNPYTEANVQNEDQNKNKKDEETTKLTCWSMSRYRMPHLLRV